MNTKNELVNEIINRRSVLGITQEQLAKLSGVGLKTIYKLEQGLGNPSLDTLEKVLDVLGLEFSIKLKK
jgi:transcriptional regulator with XRE-family HTH domain